MNIKCPNCGGELEYDPIEDKMVCTSCSSSFTSQEAADFKENEPPHFQPVNKEKMECRVYTCTECGAELLINDVETATFCAYCGQPAIVFSRVSETMKPDYIVPFIIRKERIPQILKENLGQGVSFFKDMKKYKTVDIKGVYIPYWNFDVHYHDEQIWRGQKVSKGPLFDFEREGEVDFKGIAVEASQNLNDNLSVKLEPFDLRPKKPFEIGYLQGFYADCVDVDMKKAERQMKERAGELFTAEMKKNVQCYGEPQFYKGHPKYEIMEASYVLLPVWFVTVRGKDKMQTILVNGQTGKVVGFLPYKKKKVAIFAGIISLISLPFAVIIMKAVVDLIWSNLEKNQFVLIYFVIFAMLLVAAFLVISVKKNFDEIRKSEALSGEEEAYRFVRNRQEK